MDALDLTLSALPNITDAVVYGSVALTAGFLYGLSFLTVVPTFYRDSSPLTPPTAAIGATLAMLAPLAAVLLGLAAAGGSPLLGVLYFSPLRMLACLIATPLALWLPAVALCSWAPFREQHMPLPPAQRAAAADAPAAAEPAGLPSDKKED